jgi:V8-like Glu-specific endopeptidase
VRFLAKSLLRAIIVVGLLVAILHSGRELRKTYVKYEARKATHYLSMGGGSCTGVAVGPHTILTAEHCLTDDFSIRKVPKTLTDIPSEFTIGIDGQQAQMLAVEADGFDHVLILTNVKLPAYLKIDQSNKFVQNQKLVAYGYPGDRTDKVLSEPRFDSTEKDTFHTFPDFAVFDMTALPGDSGEGLVNMSGKVVGMLSLGTNSNTGGVMPFHFTPEQLRAIN